MELLGRKGKEKANRRGSGRTGVACTRKKKLRKRTQLEPRPATKDWRAEKEEGEKIEWTQGS